MARRLGTGTGTVYTSPKKAKQLARRKRAEEAAWKARSGPVTVRKLSPEELAGDQHPAPPETP